MTSGFVEIADNVVLEGIVTGKDEEVGPPPSLGSDDDWCMHVAPNESYTQLLTNHKGYENGNLLIECEVQPREDVVHQFHTYIDRLVGQHVRVVGTWVADCAHSYDGRHCTIVDRCCDEGKTEIHPIASIIAVSPPEEEEAETRWRVELYVFSDCATRSYPWLLHQPPHSKVSRTGEFRVPMNAVHPPGHAEPSVARYVIVREFNLARSREFAVVQEDGVWVFRGTVVSGTESEGKGFYQGTVELHYVAGRRLTVVPHSLTWGHPRGEPLARSPEEQAERGSVGPPPVDPLTKRVKVTNEGSLPLSVSIAAPPAHSPFRWTPFRGALAVGAVRTVDVRFDPPETSQRVTGELVVTSDAPGSPHRVALSGHGASSEE